MFLGSSFIVVQLAFKFDAINSVFGLSIDFVGSGNSEMQIFNKQKRPKAYKNLLSVFVLMFSNVALIIVVLL